MTSAPLATLKQHPFLAGFRDEHVERLLALARDAHFDADQVIFREGDDCSDFFLVVSGLVALEIVLPRRTLRVQTLLRTGSYSAWRSD